MRRLDPGLHSSTYMPLAVHPPATSPTPAVPRRPGVSRVAELRIGKYQVLKRLHKGRISHVMLAKTCGIGGLERTVAIKVLRSRYARDARFVNSFLHEERITGSLRHPQLVQLLDSGESDYGYFMALEHISGWNLERVLGAAMARQQSVPVSVALHLAHGVASGLHHLHERWRNQERRIRVVHRDVQPANIMLTDTGDIKLIDFGNVAIEGMEHDEPSVLSAVTPYTPPEMTGRVRPDRGVDRRADIYSLGALVYTLTTGREPPVHRGSNAVVPPSAVCSNYIRDLEDLVMRMLHPEVERRWQSAASVLLALEDLVAKYRFALSRREVAQWLEGLMGKPAPVAEDSAWRAPDRDDDAGKTRILKRPPHAI